jgi:L-amino acid N-acyltransferase YncA
MPMIIRLANPKDAHQIQAIYAPYCFTPISFEVEPPTVQEMRGRIEKTLEWYPWLVCEESGELLAYGYATRHRERGLIVGPSIRPST